MDRNIIEQKIESLRRCVIGFRNLAVHDYEAINWVIVHALAHRHLDDFREFAKAVMANTSSREDR